MEPWRQGGAVGCGRRPAGEQLGAGAGSTRRRRRTLSRCRSRLPQPPPSSPVAAAWWIPTSRMRIRPARDGPHCGGRRRLRRQRKLGRGASGVASLVAGRATLRRPSTPQTAAEAGPRRQRSSIPRRDEPSEEADEDGDGNAEAVGAAVLLFSPPPPAVAAATLLLFPSSDAVAAAGT
uniref:Uncharacterized protein n=1 Tax=Oryza barthii TaxID=65489 RepID=A0A0D3GDB1_9ORYZ